MIKKKIFAALALLISAYTWALSPEELTAQLQQPNSVQGQFIQQRFLKSLKQPMQTRGEFALKKQVGLFWHVQKPLDVQLRVRPQGIAQWDKQSKTWRNSQQGNQNTQIKLFMALLSGDMRELSKHFDIQVSGSLTNWTLKLTPKTLVMKQIFTDIQITGNQTIHQVNLYEKQGDRTIMQFENTQINQALSHNAQNALE